MLHCRLPPKPDTCRTDLLPPQALPEGLLSWQLLGMHGKGKRSSVQGMGQRSGPFFTTARLAQSVERKVLNLVVVGSSPTVGVYGLAIPTRFSRGSLSLSLSFGALGLIDAEAACDTE